MIFHPPTLNNNLGGNNLIYEESEDAYYIQHGADSVRKKLGVEPLEIIVKGALTSSNIGYAYGYAIVNNQGWKTITILSAFRPLTINFYSEEFGEGTLMRTNTPGANATIDIPAGTKSIDIHTQSGNARLLLDI